MPEPKGQHRPPQPPQAPPPVTVRTTYPAFGYEVERGPDPTTRILRVWLPPDVFRNQQHMLEFLFDADASKQLSDRLLAPTVATASADQVNPQPQEG